jgi:hypothetical protein
MWYSIRYMITSTKNKKHAREITPEIIKLAVAWAKDEVNLAEVTAALGTFNMTHSYTTLARALKAHIKHEKA